MAARAVRHMRAWSWRQRSAATVLGSAAVLGASVAINENWR